MEENYHFHATWLEILEKRSPGNKHLRAVLVQLREAKQARLALEVRAVRRRGLLLKFAYLVGKVVFLRAMRAPAVHVLH